MLHARIADSVSTQVQLEHVVVHFEILNDLVNLLVTDAPT